MNFSFVIPAHNEEHYIERTLEHLAALSYPKDAYDALIIENGSTDGTLARAQALASSNVRVVHSDKKGAAVAKNIGIDYLPPKTDWVIFLDADTFVEREFLAELEAFLKKHAGFASGTTTVLPFPKTFKSSLWFAAYNAWHRLTKSSFSVKIVRRDLFPSLKFDETLVLGEDLHLLAQARAHGGFFYMPTRTVATSTRRFDRMGWWKLLGLWLFVALLPTRMQRHFAYKVVR